RSMTLRSPMSCFSGAAIGGSAAGPAKGESRPRGGHEGGIACPALAHRQSSVVRRRRMAKEAARHRLPVLLGLDPPRAVERRLAKLRCHQILQLKLLFDAERQKLVRSLADLQAAGRALTGR